MTVVLLASVLLASLVPGPAFVKAPSVTARACPKASCATASELKGGTPVEVLEVSDAWAKVAAGWVPVESLAAGTPSKRTASAPVKVLECPEPDCKVVGSLAKGAEVSLLSEAGGSALVASGGIVGYADTRQLAPVTASAAPAPAAAGGYVPPAEPPKYVPPAEAPQYIPPGEPPAYIPADAPPIYIPPAQPASVVMARAGELKKPNVHYVRRAQIDVLPEPKAGAKPTGSTLPGGAKVHVRKTSEGFVEVSTSEGAAVPSLGWVKKDDLRDLPPMIFRSRTSDIAYFPCPEAKGPKCKEQKATGLKPGDSLVAIDQSDDKGTTLVLLPGQKPGSGWVKTSELDPGK